MSLSTRTSINNDDILLTWPYMHNGTPYTISHSNRIFNTVYADDWRIDTETQTTAWDGGDFRNLNSPLPLSENETIPLSNIHTRARRQTSSRGIYNTYVPES